MTRMNSLSAVTMGQLQKKLDTIANNISNSNTTGFKSQSVNFSSLLYQEINSPPDDEANTTNRFTPEGVRVGSGAKITSTNSDLTSGSITETNRALDVALINQDQYFTIQSADGQGEVGYTRAGNFYLNPAADDTMQLTTVDGEPVMGVDGPVEIANGFEDVQINDSGQLLVTRNGNTAIEATLSITEVANDRLLTRTGDNTFVLQDAAALGIDEGEVLRELTPNEIELQSGSLEQSNVDLAQQMTDMINTQRAYQFNARSISMGDQMAGLINQIR